MDTKKSYSLFGDILSLWLWGNFPDPLFSRVAMLDKTFNIPEPQVSSLSNGSHESKLHKRKDKVKHHT